MTGQHVTRNKANLYGIMDSGADITIIGGEPFKKVAAVARLRKKNFKDTNKTPSNYDGQPFSLDGRKDLEVTFNDSAITTPVYIKMDAHYQKVSAVSWALFHTTQC